MKTSPTRILLVEDDPTSRAFLAEAAASLPAHVDAAASLAQARALLEARDYDLLLVDAQLPDGAGATLLREVRRHAATPALAHTAGTTRDELDALIDAGFAEVLAKPLTALQLLHAMRRALVRAAPAETAQAPARRCGKSPVWDADAALAIVNGRADQMAQLRALFLAELPGHRDAVLGNFATGDVVALEARLHRLQGSCGFVAAVRLGLAVRELRDAPGSETALRGFVDAATDTLAAAATPSA